MTFSGLPDAALLTALQHHGFKTVMLLRHPLDALLAFAQTQLGIDRTKPASAAFRDFVVSESARTALSTCVQWNCLEACHVIRHEDFAQAPDHALKHLRSHLGDERAHAIEIPPLLECDAPGLWAEVTPADTVKAAYAFHQQTFVLLDYPEPSHASPSAEACEQTWLNLVNNPTLTTRREKHLERHLFALEDRHREKSRELQTLQKEPFTEPDRITAKDQKIAFHKNEASRLHGLVYGVAPKRHLFRAWRALRGDRHYRQPTPALPTVVAPVDPQTISGYHDLIIGDLPVRFHKSALTDGRGTGRVAAELLRQFRELAAAIPVSPGSRPPIHFFSAPHWGPETLPERSCVLIHDIIPSLAPGYPEKQRNIFETRCRNVIRQAAKIITISQTSARDIAHHFGVNEADITVIYNGVTPLPVSSEYTPPLPGVPYLAYVGGADTHKNLEVVFEALRRPSLENVHLVLVGETERHRTLIESLRLETRVHFLGKLADADMGKVLTRATALVFPSFYEGFGLPPHEAALLGIPSICSRRPAMTELLSDAAFFADYNSPDEWARQIGTLIAHPTLARTMGELARAKSGRLQWPVIARRYLDVFRSLP
ncbi:glycosyltransferase family 1 protein [Rariglobus hedericola]